MFQRIDRPGKGHITKQEMLQFLEENGFKAGDGFEAKDLGLIMKNKIDY
jgi:Ca2+-binding EF-hand superfamily protein